MFSLQTNANLGFAVSLETVRTLDVRGHATSKAWFGEYEGGGMEDAILLRVSLSDRYGFGRRSFRKSGPTGSETPSSGPTAVSLCVRSANVRLERVVHQCFKFTRTPCSGNL